MQESMVAAKFCYPFDLNSFPHMDEGKYRSTVQNMHKNGWKAKYFKSADVSMLGHDCGVSQYPQFYDTNLKKIKCYHIHM